MKIAVWYDHYVVASGRYIVGALTATGHQVNHVGRAMGNIVWGMAVPNHYVMNPMADAPDGDEDLVIVMDSDITVLDAANRWAGDHLKTPVVVYGVDNHVRHYARPYFRRYFLAHVTPALMPFYDVVSGLVRSDTEWLPCGTDPLFITHEPKAWREREFDVAMLGVPYPNRMKVATALREAGLSVFAGVGLFYENYATVYNNARVSLCISVRGDVAQRVFETAGLGCQVLCDPQGDLELLGIDKHVHQMPSDASIEDWVATVKRLSDGDAPASNQWVWEHTWDVRLKRILDWYTSTKV